MSKNNDAISRNDLWTDIMMIPHNGDIIFSSEVEEAIKNAPTIDAVQVVRCKDCRHWKPCAGATEHIKCCEFAGYMVGENGYCVYGEVKDGD